MPPRPENWEHGGDGDGDGDDDDSSRRWFGSMYRYEAVYWMRVMGGDSHYVLMLMEIAFLSPFPLT